MAEEAVRTGRQSQIAIVAYLSRRGWIARDSSGTHWRDPRNREKVFPWSLALEAEADREAAQLAASGGGT